MSHQQAQWPWSVLPGKRHRSDCWVSSSFPRLSSPSLVPAFDFLVLHLGYCWLGLHPRPALHPLFPSFLPWWQGQVWVHGPQAETCAQGQVPSPGAVPGSLPISQNVLLSLSVLMSCLFSIANLCRYSLVSPALAIAVHMPLPSVQLCTDILPSCCRWLSPL